MILALGLNQTRTTLEGGERSHHCAISPPQESLMFVQLFVFIYAY